MSPEPENAVTTPSDSPYEMTFQKFPLPVVLVSTITGEIFNWNKAAEIEFQHTAPEAMGQPLSLITPADIMPQAEHMRRMAEFMASPRAEAGVDMGREITALRKDGSKFPAKVQIFSVGQDAIGGVVQNQTKAKDAQFRLEQALSKAEAANSVLSQQDIELRAVYEELKKAQAATLREKDDLIQKNVKLIEANLKSYALQSSAKLQYVVAVGLMIIFGLGTIGPITVSPWVRIPESSLNNLNQIMLFLGGVISSIAAAVFTATLLTPNKEDQGLKEFSQTFTTSDSFVPGPNGSDPAPGSQKPPAKMP